MRLIFAATVGALMLGACGTTMGDNPSYQEEYMQLAQDCADRDGILVPSGVGDTGDPATEYVCNRQDRLLNNN